MSKEKSSVIVEGDFEIAKPTAPVSEGTTEVVETPVEKKKEKKEYTEDELLKVFDDIIFSGEYSETISIKGRLSVTFKTRTASQVATISSELDKEPVNLRATLEERRLLLNMHYALVAYQGRDLTSMKHEDKVILIMKLPAPIMGSLMVELDKFDEKVYKACEVGEENF